MTATSIPRNTDAFASPLVTAEKPVIGQIQENATEPLLSEFDTIRSSSITPASSVTDLAPENYVGSLCSEAQQMRVAAAEAYEQASQTFLRDQTLESLERLNYALAKIDPEDVDPYSASNVLDCLPGFLESSHVGNSLSACQLIIRYHIKRAESSRNYPVCSLELCTTKFRQVINKENIHVAEHLSSLAETVDLWTALADLGEVEEHQAYHLVASSLQWVFGEDGSDASNVRYRYMKLLVVTYSRMPRKGRYKVVHDLLSMMLRINDKIGDSVHILLRLVAVTGSIPLSTWNEATSLRKRQLVESEAQVRHKEALSLCQMISRRIIESAYAKNDKTVSEGRHDFVLTFLEECACALRSPQLPSTEVLLSAFISTLFGLSKIHRNRKYCLFSFVILRALQETLVLFRGEEAETALDPVSIAFAIDTPEQANYLASRQCTLPGQPYFDLELAVTRKRITQKSGYITEAEWMTFLRQWPISGYYDHICEQIISLANRDDIPDTIQVELFKVLERIITDDPSHFNIQWLDRLSYGSATVCEALVPVTAAAFRGLEPKPYELLHRLGTRLTVPGVKSFKKRVAAFFSSISVLTDESYEIAWLYLLISIADPDHGVSQVASDKASAMLFSALHNDGVDAHLSSALLAARSKAGENFYLVQDGLRKFVRNISASKQGSQVRRLVSNLLDDGDFELAALLVEADGTFMPLSKIKPVFDEVEKCSSRQKASLRMLNAALNARPRIILSPITASTMFSALVKKLKTSTEVEIGLIGPILRELVTLAGPGIQQKRATRLESLVDSSFAKLCELVEGSSQPSRMVVVRQLIMITGCVRFWSHSQGIRKVSEIVEKLVELGWTAEKGGAHSQVIVRTVFSTAAEYRVLFNNHAVDKYLSSLQQGSPEFDCFMQLLFQYDWHANRNIDGDDQDTFKSMIMGTSRKEEELATSSMLQKYLTNIFQQADQNQNEVALRIISKALDHYLVVVDRCLPLVVSLCFSPKLSMAQSALATYAKICSRWPSSVLTKMVPGLKRCSEGSDIRAGPFKRIWQLAKESQNQRNIKLLIDAVVSSLRHDASDAYATLIITGLMQTPLDPKDAKTMRAGLMENVFTFSPRNKLHNSSHIAKMILVHVFETWLTSRYGLAKTKQTSEDMRENEALDYINIQAILLRFAEDRGFAKRTFEELLDEQYAYGSKEMEELIYGKGPDTQEAPIEIKKRRTSQ